MTSMKVKRETGGNVLMLINIEAKILFEEIGEHQTVIKNTERKN